ncbi:MAG TPA: type II toxin-antitoxin system VapC family toxin [Longimicrobiaceae bacterium]|nr:type II toxin-antitoxin system VapC family toxin [Longimicrobiaceae bacterium]
MAHELFLDASYAIALGSARDQHHAQAVDLARKIEADQTRLVTTRAIVLEIGNALAKQRHRRAAVALLEALERDPRIEVVAISEALYHEGWALFRRHHDKEWGLTDCLSFVLMQQRGLTGALTTDDHFRQAGFTALLIPE